MGLLRGITNTDSDISMTDLYYSRTFLVQSSSLEYILVQVNDQYLGF